MNTLLDILLVEDNAGDVVLFRHAIETVGALHRIRVAADGVAAVDRLFECSSGGRASCPGVVVLDLNLPKMSGAEVIQKIRPDPVLREIPLVVLTSSQHEKRVLADWDPARCLYLVKPATFDELVTVIRQMLAFLESLPVPA